MRRGSDQGGLGEVNGSAKGVCFDFPNWQGQTCVIYAGGGSLTKDQAEKTQHLNSIAVNNSWEMAPWADVLYACDFQWWQKTDSGQRALRKFEGLKCTQDMRAVEAYGIGYIALRKSCNEILYRTREIGGGGNGGFQALNLAIHFGARRILLLGYDMNVDMGVHWHGEHVGINNPNKAHFPEWIKAFSDNLPVIEKLGVEVINCTPGSSITCFKKSTLNSVITS